MLQVRIDMARYCWDVLVLTCKTKQFAAAAQSQLDQKKMQGLLPENLVTFCIEDPQEGIGSGGATLNALLIVTEHLSAKSGFTVVTSDVLKNARILLMHTGRYFSYGPCSRSFVCLPLSPETGESECLITNFDVLYHVVTTQLSEGSPAGLWVCSCDMLLSFPKDFKLNWTSIAVGDGIIGISVPATPDYATHHGAYVLDNDFAVQDLIFQGSHDILSKFADANNTIPLVSGVVYFSVFATERLLTTHVTPPLDACTYLGIDSGMEPVCISLYFDILLATALNVEEKEFVNGNRSGAFGRQASLTGNQKQFMMNARSVLWRQFNDLKFKVVLIKSGTHCYLDMQKSPIEYCNSIRKFCPTFPGYCFNSQVHSYVDEEADVSSSAILINSIVEKNVRVGKHSFIVNSFLTSDMVIGNNCFVYGLDETSSKKLSTGIIPNSSFVMGISVQHQKSSIKRMFVCLRSDVSAVGKEMYLESDENSIEGVLLQSQLQYGNMIDRAVQNSEMLPMSYHNVLLSSSQSRCNKNTLFMAKIFPTYHLRFDVDISHSMQLLHGSTDEVDNNSWHDYLRSSFCELLESVDTCSEFRFQQSLYFAVACRRIRRILSTNLNTSLLPLFKMFVLCQEHKLVLDLLDQLAIQAVDKESQIDRRPDISARAFACIADVFGFMAGSSGGLRSGPAANKQWKQALHLLHCGDIVQGVAKLAEVRQNWLQHPDQLIRAARHYEGAEQILIQHAVKSASLFIHPSPSTMMSKGVWYIAECPARIDIAGGWTDTPPVCYEYGGAVVNFAVKLNGKRPIGARIRKLDKPVIRLTLVGENVSDTQCIECTYLDHLLDYSTPQAPGALLKACIILSRIVSVTSDLSLKEQLFDKLKGGFELQTWSKLPRGSGLGTSSILAGAILRVLYAANGLILDQDSLLHAVLIVEQMLTTGGGWQDQVGGIVGGFKVGRSAATLPLQITTELLVISDAFFEVFSNHLKLIYTGKTRLARNLLQTVIRNWYTKRPGILKTCKELKETAEQCALSVKSENLAQIGSHMNDYWEQKKCIASGCEPDSCGRMMDKLRPYTLGMLLGGAGGGGFMYVLTKEPLSNEFIATLLQDVDGAQDAIVYDAEIDRIGMVCYTKNI